MIIWSCKVESDNDVLKGEVLPKREELVESERRLSEKTNDLREVRKPIFLLFQMDQEGDVSRLIYCLMLVFNWFLQAAEYCEANNLTALREQSLLLLS